MRADLVTTTGASVSLRPASTADGPFLYRLYAEQDGVDVGMVSGAP